ncbi:MAG: polysaccharide deacetylase family protein [Armatimonadota bacterium]|nr:MAG: polysaccharide deacetylase family protein [Armatimonadota bacterium]
MRRLIHRRGAVGDPLIALTFDDGPSREWTPAILDTLQLHDVAATFFVVGEQARKHPDLLLRAAAQGHCIGSHADRHTNLTLLTTDGVLQQVDAATKAATSATGRATRLFRPPYGSYDRRLIELLDRRGLTMVLWSVDAMDWWLRDADRIARRVTPRLFPGCIILLHDARGDRLRVGSSDRAATVEALPQLIAGARARGYRFVTIKEMLSAEG